MDEKTRIDKDIIMFEENIKALNEKNEELLNDERVILGSQYYEDAKYYFEKKEILRFSKR